MVNVSAVFVSVVVFDVGCVVVVVVVCVCVLLTHLIIVAVSPFSSAGTFRGEFRC